MKQIPFQIHSLGCKVNQYDAASLRKELEALGFIYSDLPRLIIVNTCSVTKQAIVKDKQLINKLKKLYPGAMFLIMGCWLETDKQSFDNLDKLLGIDKDKLLLWGVGRSRELLARIKERFKVETDPAIDKTNLVSTDKSRYFLKVGDGCNQFCSYCIIPYARGRLKSRAINDIVNEAKKATEAGYFEIILSGIHLGRYGQDGKHKTSLLLLLKKLLKIKDLGRIRLSSIEVNEISSELIELMAKNRKMCQHLHISLQSGSNRILEKMNRPYDKKYFENKVRSLRKKMPNIAISTDLIVGFPTESEKEYRESYNFVKKISFSKVHVFPFSAHEITAAYQMQPKVERKIIKQRAKELRDLSDLLEKKYEEKIMKRYKGKEMLLVFENNRRIKNNQIIVAKNEYGFNLMIKGEKLKKIKAREAFKLII